MRGLLVYNIRVRVIRERLSAPPGHVIGQGPAPGGGVVPAAAGTALRNYKQIQKIANVYEILNKTRFC